MMIRLSSSRRADTHEKHTQGGQNRRRHGLRGCAARDHGGGRRDLRRRLVGTLADRRRKLRHRAARNLLSRPFRPMRCGIRRSRPCRSWPTAPPGSPPWAHRATFLHPDYGPSGSPHHPYGLPWTVVKPPRQPLTTVKFDRTPRRATSARTRSPHRLRSREATAPPAIATPSWSIRPPATCTSSGTPVTPARLHGRVRCDPEPSVRCLRPAGWTSADAAGLPILPGLVNYDEATSGVMDHAIRFTAACTQESYLWPARHEAGQADTSCPPMGARFRLTPASPSRLELLGLLPDRHHDDEDLWPDPRRQREQLVLPGARHGWTDTDVDQLKQIPAAGSTPSTSRA